MILLIEPAQIVALMAGTVLPLVVGLASTRMASGARKAMTLLALAVATNVAAEIATSLQAGEVIDLGPMLLGAVTTFLVGVGMHYGLWKPTGASTRAIAFGDGKHLIDAPAPAPQIGTLPPAKTDDWEH